MSNYDQFLREVHTWQRRVGLALHELDRLDATGDLPPGTLDDVRAILAGDDQGGTPSNRHVVPFRTAEQASGGHLDGRGAPDAPTGRTRDQAHHAARHAQTQGGQAGIATGLAAIALAILAGQEPRP